MCILIGSFNNYPVNENFLILSNTLEDIFSLNKEKNMIFALVDPFDLDLHSVTKINSSQDILMKVM